MEININTDRLLLRTPVPDDAKALRIALDDPEFSRNMVAIPYPYEIHDAVSFIRESTSPDNVETNLRLLVFLNDTGELAGGIGLDDINKSFNSAELGYWCVRPLRGRGIATEAARAILRHAFENLNLNRVFARCMENNLQSTRVLQKIGMKHEGTAREELIRNNEPFNTVSYAILKSDWDKGICISPIRLETPRLILRTPRFDDIERIIEPVNHPDISVNSAHIPHPFTIDDARKWYAHQSMDETQWDHVTLLMFLKSTDELIGSCWLRANIHHHKAGVAYWTAVKHWGNGYATEAASELIRYGFEKLGLRRITTSIIVGNDASVRVAEKLGMKFECTSMEEWWHDETPLHCHHYVLMKSEQ